MDLVECMWTLDERNTVINYSNETSQEVKKITKELDERIMIVLAYLEGKKFVAKQCRPSFAGIEISLCANRRALWLKLYHWKPQ